MTPARSGLRLVERPANVEASLWRRLRLSDDPRCREKLFQLHMRLAKLIAGHEFKRRPPYGLDRGDFEQLAYRGLLEAIDKFDPLRGIPFDAFARHRIRGAISDGISKSSEGAAQYSHRRRAEIERLRSLNEAGVAGDDAVVALAELASALAIGLIAESAADVDTTMISDQPILGAYESSTWRELQLSVLSEIERLPEAERIVLQQHYLHGVAFLQIAQLLGLSKGRISQLHRGALQKVRERLRSY